MKEIHLFMNPDNEYQQTVKSRLLALNKSCNIIEAYGLNEPVLQDKANVYIGKAKITEFFETVVAADTV